MGIPKPTVLRVRPYNEGVMNPTISQGLGIEVGFAESLGSLRVWGLGAPNSRHWPCQNCPKLLWLEGSRRVLHSSSMGSVYGEFCEGFSPQVLIRVYRLVFCSLGG